MFPLTSDVIHSLSILCTLPVQTLNQINIWAMGRLKKWTLIHLTLSTVPPLLYSPLPPQTSPSSKLSWTRPCLWCDWGLSPQEKLANIHQNLSTEAEKTRRVFSLVICRNYSLVNKKADCSIRRWAPSCRRAAQQWSNQEESWLVNMACHVWAPLSLGNAAQRQRGPAANSFQLI